MGRAFYTDLPAHLKFTLVALADHADDDGGNVYPGQQLLARKVGVSVRAVRDQLHELETRGYLLPERRRTAHGTRPYRLNVALLPDGADRKPTADRQKLPTGSPAPVSNESTGSPASVDRKPTADKPSVTVSKKQPRETPRRTRLPDLFPLTEELRRYCVAKGCRSPERTHEAFVTFYRGSGKPQLDWIATFHTWVLGAHGGPDWKACGCQPRAFPGQPAPGSGQAALDAKRAASDLRVAEDQKRYAENLRRLEAAR